MKLKNGMKVIAPSGCENYLTEGKEYEVFNVELSHNKECEFNFNFIDDKRKSKYSILKGSAHLNGQDWIIKNETNMKLSEKLLKEIYNAVDAELKTKIEIEVPEIKPKLEVGKWYKSVGGLYCVTDIENDLVSAYGFENGNWRESGTFKMCFAVNDILATPEEVETALIAEAKRRGFKEGAKCVSLLRPYGYETLFKYFDFEFDLNRLWIDSDDYKCCVFSNGKWATIISEPTQKEILQKQVDELKRQIDAL